MNETQNATEARRLQIEAVDDALLRLRELRRYYRSQVSRFREYQAHLQPVERELWSALEHAIPGAETAILELSFIRLNYNFEIAREKE